MWPTSWSSNASLSTRDISCDFSFAFSARHTLSDTSSSFPDFSSSWSSASWLLVIRAVCLSSTTSAMTSFGSLSSVISTALSTLESFRISRFSVALFTATPLINNESARPVASPRGSAPGATSSFAWNLTVSFCLAPASGLLCASQESSLAFNLASLASMARDKGKLLPPAIIFSALMLRYLSFTAALLAVCFAFFCAQTAQSLAVEPLVVTVTKVFPTSQLWDNPVDKRNWVTEDLKLN